MVSDSEPVLQHLHAAAKELANVGVSLDERTRKTTLKAARDLVATLEKPQDVLWRYPFTLGSPRMAMRVGLDMGLYGVLVQADGKPVSAQELATACKAEKLFTVRIMRVLSAAGFVTEVGHEVYAANELTRAMTHPITDGVVKASYDLPAQVQAAMHDYFRERGYSSPVDGLDGPMQWTLHTKLPYFEFVQSNPELFKAFIP